MKKNKKDSNFITFIKGFIIGLGIIFPISASGLAIAMGMYEKLLKIINNLKKELKKEWKFLLSFGLGVVLSAITSCLLIKVTYEKFPIATLLFFEGLVIGGIPVIFKKTNAEFKLKNIIWTVIGIILLISITLFDTGSNVVLSTSAIDLLKVFGAGALAAGTMIIPGVSGSMILLIIGYYNPMLDIISNIVHFNDLGTNLLIAGVFGIGMIIGIFIVSKIMDYFLRKHERKTYFAIVGFIIASICVIAIKVINSPFNVYEYLVGAILLLIGFLISFKFLKED